MDEALDLDLESFFALSSRLFYAENREHVARALGVQAALTKFWHGEEGEEFMQSYLKQFPDSPGAGVPEIAPTAPLAEGMTQAPNMNGWRQLSAKFGMTNVRPAIALVPAEAAPQ